MLPRLNKLLLPTLRFWRRFKGFSLFIVRRFFDERLSDAATSLTFTTLLSLVPLLAVALSIIAYFPSFGPVVENMRAFVLTTLVPEAASRVLTDWVPRFAQNAARMTAIGLTVLVIVSLMLVATIESTFNTIWRVRKQRPLWHRALIYPTVLLVGPVLIGAAVSVTTYVLSASGHLLEPLSFLSTLALRVIPALMTVTGFTLSYWLVPYRYVPWSHALIGGLVAGALFQVLSHGLGIYLNYFNSYNVIYGAFASIPIFLLWLFSAWHIAIAGALVAASLSHWRGATWETRHMSGALLIDGLRVLAALYRSKEPLSFRELRRRAPIAIEDLECLLEQFRGVGWIKKSGKTWSLCHNLRLTLFDVYRLLVFNPAEIASLPEEEKALADALKKSEALHSGTLAQPLATLFNATD